MAHAENVKESREPSIRIFEGILLVRLKMLKKQYNQAYFYKIQEGDQYYGNHGYDTRPMGQG